MNTRPIPILMALGAAGMTCVISIVQKVSFGIFLLRLFCVIVIFYLLGIVVGILFLEALGPEKKKGEKDSEENEDVDVGAEGEDTTGERSDELENVTENVSGTNGTDEDDEPFAEDEG